MSLLAARTIAEAAALRSAFDTARPFRHVVIDEFLEPGHCRALQQQFPPFDDDLARNELGVVGRKCVHTDIAALGPAYRELDRFLQQPAFLRVVEQITGIDDLRYDPHYFGGGTHENRSGQGLHPHVDFNVHPKTGEHRRLNLILYLDDAWSPDWGGCIRLHRDPWDRVGDEVVTVAPRHNRCVLFETSERSWHGFDPIGSPDGRVLSRRSFAIYLYTATRPAVETAPSHGTLYVYPPLPRHLAPGHVLTDADCAQLRGMLTERDDWIRLLYAREQSQSAAIAGLQHKLDRAIVRRLVRLMAPAGTRRRRLLERLAAGRSVARP